MNYCFLGEACGICGDKDTADPVDGKRKMPISVAHDDVKGAFWTLRVPVRGPTESVLKWFSVGGIRGYGEDRPGGVEYSVEDGHCGSSYWRLDSD